MVNFASRRFQLGLVVILCLLVALPLIRVPIAPFIDIPGLIGRYTIQASIADDPYLSRWYDFEWQFIGFISVDLLVEALHGALGVIGAVKLITIAIPILFVLGVVGVSRTVHGAVTFSAIIACALSWHRYFIFGFLYYSLGVALALLGYALWRWLYRRGGVPPYLAILAFAFLTFISHLAAWMIFCVVVGATLLADAVTNAPTRRSPGRWTDLLASSILLLLPLLAKSVLADNGGGQPMSGWFSFLDKGEAAFSVLRDYYFYWDIACAALAMALILWMICSKSFKADKGLALASLLLFLLFLLLPDHALGGGDVDKRLAPVAVTFALLAYRPSAAMTPGKIKLLYVFAALFFAARIAGNVVSVGTLWNYWERHLAIFDIMPKHSSVATFTAKKCDRFGQWERPLMSHFTGLHIAYNHGYSNDQWAVPGASMMQIRNPPGGNFMIALDPAQNVYPPCWPTTGELSYAGRIEAVRSGSYDYVFTTDLPDARRYNAALRLIWKSDTSRLYQVEPQSKRE